MEKIFPQLWSGPLSDMNSQDIANFKFHLNSLSTNFSNLGQICERKISLNDRAIKEIRKLIERYNTFLSSLTPEQRGTLTEDRKRYAGVLEICQKRCDQLEEEIAILVPQIKENRIIGHTLTIAEEKYTTHDV